MSPRRSTADAEHTRERIIARAIEIASVEGLEGVSIGRLASDVQMSKAGVLGRFGTKEALQRDTLEAAIDIFRAEVWEPSLLAPPGLRRLAAICEHWISYLERGVFPGGCFLTAASCEFDDRPGPVHEAIADAHRLWLATLEAEVRAAIDNGELSRDYDPAAVAFRLNAYAMGANQALQLLGDARGAALAHDAMREVLGLPRPRRRRATAKPRKPRGAAAPAR